MGKIIAVASGKGGVGKTTIVANLGATLASFDKRVLLIDLDIGLRNLDLVLGLQNIIVYDLVDVYENKIDLFEASYHFKKYGELYFLPASQTVDKEDIDKSLFCEFLNGIKERFDYIILDCPAGIETGLKNALCVTDTLIVVVTPDFASVRDGDRVVEVSEEYDVKDKFVIINKFDQKNIRKGYAPNVDEVLERLGTPLLGIVENDNEMIRFQNNGELIFENKRKKITKNIKNCAKRLTGETIPIKIKWKTYKNKKNS